MSLRRAAATTTLALLALATMPGVRAGGTIDTNGAIIEAGDAPTPGTVTIDPAAAVGDTPVLPAIEGPGDLPVISGAMPAAPSYGDGSDGMFELTSGSTELAPGTHQFTSFAVSNGATVTLSGATTILVQDAVNIAGSLVSDVEGGAITIRCGGGFMMASRNPPSAVRTTQTSSPIEVTAGGLVAIGSHLNNLDAHVEALSSDVLVQAYGVSEEAASITLRSGQVLAPAGAITMRSVGWVSSGGIVNTRLGIVDCLGPLTIRSYEGNLTANSNGDFHVENGPITFECKGWLYIGGDLVVSNAGDIDLLTEDGPFWTNGTITTPEGDLTVRCGGSVDLYGQATGPTGPGNISIRVHGTSRLRSSENVATVDGDVELVSAGTIDFQSFSRITSAGTLTVASSEGDVLMRASSALAGQGTTIVRAAGDVYVGEETPPEKASIGTSVVLDTASLEISAGGAITLDALTAQTVSGDLHVLAGGDLAVAVGRSVVSAGALTLQSIGGDVDVSGASLRTDDTVTSDDLAIETWKPGGVIDASSATIRSGDGSTRSGDVALVIHDPGPTRLPAVSGYVLPRKVKARLDDDRPEKTKVVVSGYLDLGPDVVDLTQPATITIGDVELEIAGFEASGNGRKLTYRDDTLQVVVALSKRGSSRAKLRLLARGQAIAGAVAEDGEAEIAITTDDVDARGTVVLTKGGFRLGKPPGALVAPAAYPDRVKAKLAGGGSDALQLVLGFTTDGTAPDEAPDVVVRLGDDIVLDVASTELDRRGDRFTGPGVVVDYRRATITVKANGLSLSDALAEGAQPVVVGLDLGPTIREVRVRMARKGKKLLY